MLKKFFTVAYMFGPYAIAMSRSEKMFFGISVLLLVLSAILYVAKHTSKDKLRSGLLSLWFHVTFWIGLFSLLWAGLRYETVEYLSANIIDVAIFVIGIVWALFILKYEFTTYRRARALYDKELEKKKYM